MAPRPIAGLLGLIACAPSPSETGTPVGRTTTTTTTTTPTTGLVLESTPLSCADPSARALGPWERLTLPGPPTTGIGLTGVGVAVADLDGDGWEDLVLPGETGTTAWRGPPPFTEAPDWIPAGVDLAVSAIPADLDGDGLLDLVIGRWDAPNQLLHNTGSGFEEATPASWLAHAGRTQAVTAADLDGDGDLDLFFGSYGDRPAQSNDPGMAPADPAELYRNDGAAWIDLSMTLPAEVHDGYTFAASFLDLDGDGRPTGFLANDFGEVRPSLRLDPTGELGFTVDASWHPGSEDMSLGVGDVNGDGVPDFLVTSAIEILALASGEAAGAPGVWADAGEAWGLAVDTELDGARQFFGWGADWGDVDNDGDLDGVASFGHWDDWPTIDGQRDALWEQTGPLAFEERAAALGVDDDGPGRGLVLADLDHDGWLDLVKRQVGTDLVIHRSRCGEARALELALRQPGANSRAIGARVVVRAGDTTWTRWLTAGGTSLYAGNPPEIHLGVGNRETVDSVEILWPDGSVDQLEDVETGLRWTLSRTDE